MESLKEIKVLSGHSDRVWSVSWNPNGNLLASCGGDKTIKLWAYFSHNDKWSCVHTESHHHTRTVRCVAWSPCGTLLATAGFDSIVGLWRVDGGAGDQEPPMMDLVTDLASHNYEVKRVCFSAGGQLLASCARDKTVQIWEIGDEGDCDCAAVLSSHSEDVKTVCWHPSIDILVSGSYDNSIKVYREDLDEWSVVASLNGHLSTVWQVSFNCSGDILASCSDDRTVRLWVTLNEDFSKWMVAAVLDGYHDRAIYDISWAPYLNVLCSVSRDNSVCVHRIGEVTELINGDAGSGVNVELLSKISNAHEEDINCCSWRLGHRGDSMILATGSNDGLIKLWKYSDLDLPID